MKDRLAKSVFWIVWSRVLVQGASLLTTVVVARLLAPSDYGVMALATVWTETLGWIVDIGLAATIVQFRDLDDRELNTLFWLMLAASGSITLVLWASAPVIASWFEARDVSDVLRALALTLPLTALRVVPESLLRKSVTLDKIAQAQLVATILAIPAVLAFAWGGAGVWALVVGVLITAATHTAVVFLNCPWTPGLAVGSPRLRILLRYSLSTVGSRLCWATYQSADTVVLGKMVGSGLLGQYTVARQLAMIPVERVSTVVNQLALPVMAELQGDIPATRRMLLRSIRLTTTLSVPLCLAIAIAADDLVTVLLTSKWQPAVPLVQLLSIYALFRSVDVLLPPVLMAAYRVDFLFRYTATLLVIMPIAFWVAAVIAEAPGVAAAWVLVYPLVMSRMAYEAFRAAQTSWSDVARQMFPAAFGGVVLAAVMLVVRNLWAVTADGFPIIRLLTSVFAGQIAYLAAVAVVSASLRRELTEVVFWTFRGRPRSALR